MKYSKSERMEIGKRILRGELTVDQAALEYGINRYTARDYFREFKVSLTPEEVYELRGARKGAHQYSHEERIEIGRKVTVGELGVHEASIKYGLSPYTVRDYGKLYKVSVDLSEGSGLNSLEKKFPEEYKSYLRLTKRELITEVLRLKGLI